MPKKVELTPEDFRKLESTLVSMGFRAVDGAEFRRDFKRMKLVAPRPRPGREVGFVFHANGLAAKVWTTWLRAEEEMRKEDAGWVIIVEDDSLEYSGKPVHRTKNFCLNLLKRAWIAKWRVLHRPLCPQCDQFMDIAPGKALGQKFWLCRRRSSHADGHGQTIPWDHRLPPKAKDYVTKVRRKRRKAKEARERRLGRPSTPAVLTRIPW